MSESPTADSREPTGNAVVDRRSGGRNRVGTWGQYGVALGAPVASLGVAWVIPPAFDAVGLLPFYLAVALASAWGGPGPAAGSLLATAVSAWLLLRPAVGMPGSPEGAGLIRYLAFLGVAALVGFLASALRGARLRAREEAMERAHLGERLKRIGVELERERERARDTADELRQAKELLQIAAAEAERAREEAEAAGRAKSEFLGVMSHELRTPLNAIAGYAELLEQGVYGPVTEAQRSSLERIRRNQRHLLTLISQILNHAKIEAGQVHYQFVEVLVERMLANVSALVEPQVRAKGVAFVYRGCDPGLTTWTDREKAEQILLNLLSNAIKFTPSGGRIEVECRAGGETVLIHVRDTGRGIAKEKIETIFDPFVQGDTGTMREAEGVGLGLAISRSLAGALHGDLSVSSELGKGSTFTLTLPRMPASHRAEETGLRALLGRITSFVRRGADG